MCVSPPWWGSSRRPRTRCLSLRRRASAWLSSLCLRRLVLLRLSLGLGRLPRRRLLAAAVASASGSAASLLAAVSAGSASVGRAAPRAGSRAAASPAGISPDSFFVAHLPERDGEAADSAPSVRTSPLTGEATTPTSWP